MWRLQQGLLMIKGDTKSSHLSCSKPITALLVLHRAYLYARGSFLLKTLQTARRGSDCSRSSRRNGVHHTPSRGVSCYQASSVKYLKSLLSTLNYFNGCRLLVVGHGVKRLWRWALMRNEHSVRPRNSIIQF